MKNVASRDTLLDRSRVAAARIPTQLLQVLAEPQSAGESLRMPRAHVRVLAGNLRPIANVRSSRCRVLIWVRHSHEHARVRGPATPEQMAHPLGMRYEPFGFQAAVRRRDRGRYSRERPTKTSTPHRAIAPGFPRCSAPMATAAVSFGDCVERAAFPRCRNDFCPYCTNARERFPVPLHMSIFAGEWRPLVLGRSRMRAGGAKRQG